MFAGIIAGCVVLALLVFCLQAHMTIAQLKFANEATIVGHISDPDEMTAKRRLVFLVFSSWSLVKQRWWLCAAETDE